jgi:type IV secretory pathway VirB2 component (pilin)
MSPTSGDGRRILTGRLVLVGELVVLVLVLAASAAYAQQQPGQGQPELAGSIDQVLTNIRNWVMGILAGLATVFLSVGGVRYVMGGGDPGEIEKAKTAFKAAGIGYGLAALAPLVVTVLQGIVGPGR